MSAEIASLDKVRGAVAHIRSHGGTATADRVIAHIGGGSKATVLRHLKSLREGEVPQEIVPAVVMDLVRPALAEIYAAGARAEADRSAAGLVRLTTTIEELDAQVDELAEENVALRDRLDAAAKELEQTQVHSEQLRASLTQSARELQTAKNELALERGAGAEKLGNLMAQFEASVASITRIGRAKQQRNRDPSG